MAVEKVLKRSNYPMDALKIQQSSKVLRRIQLSVLIHLLKSNQNLYIKTDESDDYKVLWSLISQFNNYYMDTFICGCYNPYSHQKNLNLLFFGYIRPILGCDVYILYPMDILNICSIFCYDLKCLQNRSTQLQIHKKDIFFFVESIDNGITFWRGLHELTGDEIKRVWNVKIINNNNKPINLSIGIANQYGKPKKSYFINIINGIIDNTLIKVRNGDIISIVYIRWIVRKTGSKRIVFFINDIPCNITLDINYIVWHHDYKLTAKVSDDCKMRIV